MFNLRWCFVVITHNFILLGKVDTKYYKYNALTAILC